MITLRVFKLHKVVLVCLAEDLPDVEVLEVHATVIHIDPFPHVSFDELCDF